MSQTAVRGVSECSGEGPSLGWVTFELKSRWWEDAASWAQREPSGLQSPDTERSRWEERWGRSRAGVRDGHLSKEEAGWGVKLEPAVFYHGGLADSCMRLRFSCVCGGSCWRFRCHSLCEGSTNQKRYHPDRGETGCGSCPRDRGWHLGKRVDEKARFACAGGSPQGLRWLCGRDQ